MKKTYSAIAVLGILGLTSMANATETVHNYRANQTNISWDGGAPTSNTLKSTDTVDFTGYTIVNSAGGNKRNVTFEAPKINMKSAVSIRNDENNSITFNNALVNFDEASWNTSATYQGRMSFAGTSGIEITQNSLAYNSTENPLIKARMSGDDVNLVVQNGAIKDGQSLQMCLVNDEANISELHLNTDNNPLYNIQQSGANLTLAQKSANEIAQNEAFDDEQAALLKSMLSVKGNALFDTVATLLQMGDTSAALATLDNLKPATAAAQMAAFDTTVSTIRAIYNHIIPANDEDILAGMKERNHLTFWTEGLYYHTRNDMKKQGFTGHQAGFAIGADTFVSDHVLMGAGYSQTGGKFRSDKGKNTDLDGYTGFIYGSWKPNRFFVSWMGSYTRMKYNTKGVKWDANVYGGQGSIGYEWGWINAFVGPRYIRLDTSKYDNAHGAKVSTKDTDVLTGVAGIHMQHVFKDANNWRLVPSGHASVTYDIKQADDESNISYAGQHIYTFKGEKQKRFGTEVGAGLKLTNGPMEMAVSYEAAFKKKSYTNGCYATLKYHF